MHVLLVEDDADDAQAARELLVGGGSATELTRVESLAAALAYLRERSCDAILLDMTLPDGRGAAAVERVRAEAACTPIVILSQGADEGSAAIALQAGAQDYLDKGRLDEETLRRALRYAIERQQLLDRIAASEARLKDENALLRNLTDAATRVFSTLDARAIVKLMASEARLLWGANVALCALRGGGELVCTEGGDEGEARPDEFSRRAFEQRGALLSASRTRLAVPVAGTNGQNEWLIDIAAKSGAAFDDNDVFALELLRHYTSIAIQNVSLFGELHTQRASVLKLNQLKDDLIAVLAHDFRGPLTTIMGFAELLEQEALEGADAQQALRTIQKSAARLATLANDTLSLSRAERGEMQVGADAVNVAGVAGDVAESLRAQREVRVLSQCAQPLVLGDPALLHQLFANVIGNAVKYSPGGEPVDVRITQEEDRLRIAVSDRGIGVPADEIEGLFERFSRASNAKQSSIKGTGLGLYIANTLAQRHGGRIEVESTVGKGSTFSIVLPRAGGGAGGILRAVLVSADEELAPFVLHELRQNRCAARHERTAQAAIERIKAEVFDLAIVDRESVFGDVRALARAAARAQPPVALVGIGSAGAGDVWSTTLPKPFLSADLRAVLERLRLREPVR